MKEVGSVILGSRNSRQQHGTSSGNETGCKLEDENHTHAIPVHSRFWSFGNC